jgi:hypothetical protein
MSFLPHINEPPLRSELNHRRVYSRAPALERFLARMRKPLPLSVGLGKSRCNGNPSSQTSARSRPARKTHRRMRSGGALRARPRSLPTSRATNRPAGSRCRGRATATRSARSAPTRSTSLLEAGYVYLDNGLADDIPHYWVSNFASRRALLTLPYYYHFDDQFFLMVPAQGDRPRTPGRAAALSSPATNKSGKTPEKGAGNLANSPAAFQIS